MDVGPGLRPGGQEDSVCHFLREKGMKYPFPVPNLIVTLRPHHEQLRTIIRTAV